MSSRGSDKRYADRTSKSSDKSSDKSYGRKEEVRPWRENSTSTQKSGSWQRVQEMELKDASGSDAGASSAGGMDKLEPGQNV